MAGPGRWTSATLIFMHVQVQALRAVEQYLGLEKLYVLGTNCVDNGPRQGLEKFLKAASTSPDTVLHYEFMQVHFLLPHLLLMKHLVHMSGTMLLLE